MANAMSSHYLEYMFKSNKNINSNSKYEENLLDSVHANKKEDTYLYKDFAHKALSLGKKALEENQKLKSENKFL